MPEPCSEYMNKNIKFCIKDKLCACPILQLNEKVYSILYYTYAVNPLIICEYRNMTMSNQPTRLFLPVVTPYS